jgi:hypothetical protein
MLPNPIYPAARADDPVQPAPRPCLHFAQNGAAKKDEGPTVAVPTEFMLVSNRLFAEDSSRAVDFDKRLPRERRYRNRRSGGTSMGKVSFVDIVHAGKEAPG